MSRWNSWGSAAPMWVPGVLLVAAGIALLWAAGRAVSRGSR